jgi:hypothetical protein
LIEIKGKAGSILAAKTLAQAWQGTVFLNQTTIPSSFLGLTVQDERAPDDCLDDKAATVAIG